MLHRFHDAVFHVVLDDDTAYALEGAVHRRQLGEDFRAVAAVLHHFLHGLKVPYEAGQTVYHALGLGVAVMMAVVVMDDGAICQHMLML